MRQTSYCLATSTCLILMPYTYMIDICLWILSMKFHCILIGVSKYYDQFSHIVFQLACLGFTCYSMELT